MGNFGVEDNLRQVMSESVDLSMKDRLSNLELHVSDLRRSALDFQRTQLAQTQMLQTIQSNTSDMIAAWNAASGAWKTVQVISKVVKICMPIILALAVFWGAFTHGNKVWIKMMEFVK